MSTLKKKKVPVAIIMGSDSDWPVMKEASVVLKQFKVEFQVEVVSAHRTPEKMYEFAKNASAKYDIIIAGAGGAAHLPGMVASLTHLPVIGVPVLVGPLEGVDALLSIAQMPKGVPVATVGVNNSSNAALLAVRVLALQSPKLEQKLKSFTKKQKTKVKIANGKLKSRQKPRTRN